MKSFEELSEREILALAIASEEDDNRVYLTFAEDLHDRYPSTAKVFEEMALVESGHHQMLTDLYQERFGPHILPIRRGDVNFFIKRPPVWLTENLSLDTIRREAELREAEALRLLPEGGQADAGSGHSQALERSCGDRTNA